MFIDITLKITPEMMTAAQGNEKKALIGHLGTHLDIMNKEFPSEYLRREGLVFDVTAVQNREIDLADVALARVQPGMFVAFYSAFIERVAYGTPAYFSEHPQLSEALIDALLAKGVSVIGVDFAGVRRGKAHTPMDQHCADRGVFIIENLCNLQALPQKEAFLVHTFPMNFVQMSGLPCRVVAEV